MDGLLKRYFKAAKRTITTTDGPITLYQATATGSNGLAIKKISVESGILKTVSASDGSLTSNNESVRACTVYGKNDSSGPLVTLNTQYPNGSYTAKYISSVTSSTNPIIVDSTTITSGIIIAADDTGSSGKSSLGGSDAKPDFKIVTKDVTYVTGVREDE